MLSHTIKEIGNVDNLAGVFFVLQSVVVFQKKCQRLNAEIRSPRQGRIPSQAFVNSHFTVGNYHTWAWGGLGGGLVPPQAKNLTCGGGTGPPRPTLIACRYRQLVPPPKSCSRPRMVTTRASARVRTIRRVTYCSTPELVSETLSYNPIFCL